MGIHRGYFIVCFLKGYRLTAEWIKYGVFFLGSLVGVPTAIFLAISSRLFERGLFFLAIFFTCELVDVNFLSQERERLVSRGFSIGMIDLVTLVLFFFIVLNGKRKVTFLPPGSVIYFLFLFFSAVSILNAHMPFYSLFGFWTLLRMYAFYWVMYNYIDGEEDITFFCNSICAVIFYLFVICLKQRYLDGRHACVGSFDHQNSLVMYMNLMGSIVLARFIHCQDKVWQTVVWGISYAMAGICVVLTLSRMGLACFGFLTVVIIGFSFLSEISVKKVSVLVLCLFCGLVVGVKASDTIINRFKYAHESSGTLRVKLWKAALRMSVNKPLGVGLNNWIYEVRKPDYDDIFPIPAGWNLTPEKSRLGRPTIETSYGLVIAESGWHTFFFYALFLLSVFYRNIRNYYYFRKSELFKKYSFISLGLIGGLSAIYIESFFEWVLRQSNNFYQFMLIAAVVGGLTKILKKQVELEDESDLETINERKV